MSVVALAIIDCHSGNDNLIFIRKFNHHETTFNDDYESFLLEDESIENSIFEVSTKESVKIATSLNYSNDNTTEGSYINILNGLENGKCQESRGTWDNCPVRHQFLLLNALSRFNLVLERSFTNRNYLKSFFAGLICGMDNFLFYGYVTNTNIKIIISTEDRYITVDSKKKKDSTNNTNDIPANQDIQTLLTQIHGQYVEYSLNPFQKSSSNQTRQGVIRSNRFNVNIDGLVAAYNDKVDSS